MQKNLYGLVNLVLSLRLHSALVVHNAPSFNGCEYIWSYTTSSVRNRPKILMSYVAYHAPRDHQEKTKTINYITPGPLVHTLSRVTWVSHLSFCIFKCHILQFILWLFNFHHLDLCLRWLQNSNVIYRQGSGWTCMDKHVHWGNGEGSTLERSFQKE